ncbi:MAG TPA: protein kinase [Polyangiaceae bacterium]|jgi:serine/threonine-protein kinase|nr:protein kinase [Polyangiaceae bacterium]
MNPQRPRDWSTARQRSKSWPPTGAEAFSVYAVRRYALHAEIGSGSVATVHLARLRGPDGFARTVAVKRLRAEYTKDAELVSLLLAGARLAATVRHPNVVPTLDVVTGDELLVITEYVHGESLAALLRTQRGRDAQAPLAVASGVFAGVLRGLHAVHEAREAFSEVDGEGRTGIARRPLSARDVLVGVDGVPRLTDLHVVGERTGEEVTAVHRYPILSATMTNAAVRPVGLDARDDVVAVATLLWEALAGRAPLPPMAPDGFEPPSRYRADLPAALDEIVAKGLRTTGSTFANAGDMASALEGAIQPATPREIGLWVESLARSALDERGRLVVNAEAADGRAVSTPPPSALAAEVTATMKIEAPTPKTSVTPAATSAVMATVRVAAPYPTPDYTSAFAPDLDSTPEGGPDSAPVSSGETAPADASAPEAALAPAPAPAPEAAPAHTPPSARSIPTRREKVLTPPTFETRRGLGFPDEERGNQLSAPDFRVPKTSRVVLIGALAAAAAVMVLGARNLLAPAAPASAGPTVVVAPPSTPSEPVTTAVAPAIPPPPAAVETAAPAPAPPPAAVHAATATASPAPIAASHPSSPSAKAPRARHAPKNSRDDVL